MNDNLVIENKKLVSIPEGCTSLVIPDGVTSIASHALRGAQGLKSISLPSSITSFDSYVFDYCPELASIHIESIEAWCKIAFPHGFYLFRYARELYVNGELVTDLVIPEGVTEIPPYAFSHCGAISSVTLPEGLEKIGYYAFDDCWNLKSVKLPSTLKSIAAGAFGRCEELEDVYIEDVAAWCNASMPEYDFRINGNPLSYARNLYVKGEPANDLVIPEGVTEIRPNAFTHFTALRSVSLPKSLQTVGEYAFWACGITSLDIPDALTRIEKGAFSGTNIKELTIPKTVKNLCMRAFSFCKKLKKLTLEPGPVIFGDEVFSNCSSLTSLILPDGFPYFGETVFDECTNVVAVMNVTDIAEWCEKAPSISKFPVRAMQNDKPIVDLVIPEGVTEIRPRAFFGCSDLRSVKIPKSVKRIGDDAFAGCPKLKSVEIPDTVESIGETSFDDIRIVTRKNPRMASRASTYTPRLRPKTRSSYAVSAPLSPRPARMSSETSSLRSATSGNGSRPLAPTRIIPAQTGSSA